MGKYVRECLEKAYEDIEEGTGAYYDWECHEYCIMPVGNPHRLIPLKKL